MEYPDIEYLQRLVEHLMKELASTVESITKLDQRVGTLETSPKALDEHEGLDASAPGP
jgi:prefoldin subunit 5